MSEEVRKAKNAVPRALFWTIALNGILAYVMVIVILMALGDINDALNSSFPILVIVENVTGSRSATTALVVGLFVISFAVSLASIASVSRLTWAWSRDRGLPSMFSVVSYTIFQSTGRESLTGSRSAASTMSPPAPSGSSSPSSASSPCSTSAAPQPSAPSSPSHLSRSTSLTLLPSAACCTLATAPILFSLGPGTWAGMVSSSMFSPSFTQPGS